MQLSIIIVNYNVKYFLEQCLYSVHKACANIAAEVFVVDNHSTDGSREYLTNKFPWVIFKWNSTNDGFGKASNSVLSEAMGEHILFLNPDTIVPSDCFTKCLSIFAANKNYGAMGVRMLDGSGRFLKESKRGFPSPLTSFFKMSGLAGLFSNSKLFARYYAGHLPQRENNEVEVLAGAFMMLSKKAVEISGGFDEDFFMYGEDVDLSFRIMQAGLINYYFAGTTILHFKGESTQKISADYVRHFYGAMLLFVEKHYSHKKATVFIIKKIIGFRKLIASLKINRAKDEPKKPLSDSSINTAIIAGQQKFNECLQLIKYAVPSVMLAGRISIDVDDKDTSIGNLEDIKLCIKKNTIGRLLFCEGELTYEAIIQQVENCKGKSDFLFHAQGSSSIVGSSDKNARGIFIAKP